MEGGRERTEEEKERKEIPSKAPRLVFSPKREEQELGLPKSHLRGLGRPVSHGDGHLVLGVTGREKPALLLTQ